MRAAMTPNFVDELFERLQKYRENPALFWNECEYSYTDIIALTDQWTQRLQDKGITRGSVVGFLGDYSPGTVALMLALMRLRAISVPFTKEGAPDLKYFSNIAFVEHMFHFENGFDATYERLESAPPVALLQNYKDEGAAGLIVFTSGSSGQPKAILHDFERVLAKFSKPRKPYRLLLLLLMDHFGGVNTLMSSLSFGGVAVCVPDRSPETVCKIVAAARAELLPTTPTFLNMILVSTAHLRHDLSSLKLITYGAEPMPEHTLARVCAEFPEVVLKQTYGLSELGVLHSKSPNPNSLWLQIGGGGFETKVEGGQLYIRSASSMIGYLNAPSPIDEDGWMCTGDLVEEKDGLIRFLGRTSDIINVGGQKVFPTEVETTLLQADNVMEATIYGRRHPLLGQCVCAKVSLHHAEDISALTSRLREHCASRLAKFKIPMRYELVGMSEHGTARAKKNRTDKNRSVDLAEAKKEI